MSAGPPFHVEQVALHETSDLRHRVLRPGRPQDPADWAAYDVPGSATFAAFPPHAAPAASAGADDASRVEPVATVTVLPERCAWRPDAVAPWQLRGMATADGLRGQGIGRLAIDAAIAHVAEQGGTLLWCNARIVAVAFYERAGFVVEGPEFDVAGIGPHRPMARPLP